MNQRIQLDLSIRELELIMNAVGFACSVLNHDIPNAKLGLRLYHDCRERAAAEGDTNIHNSLSERLQTLAHAACPDGIFLRTFPDESHAG